MLRNIHVRNLDIINVIIRYVSYKFNFITVKIPMAPNNGTFSKREEILDLHKVIKDIKVLKQQEYRTQGLRLSSSGHSPKTKAKTHNKDPPKLFVSSVPKVPVHMTEEGKEDELVKVYQSSKKQKYKDLLKKIIQAKEISLKGLAELNGKLAHMSLAAGPVPLLFTRELNTVTASHS